MSKIYPKHSEAKMWIDDIEIPIATYTMTYEEAKQISGNPCLEISLENHYPGKSGQELFNEQFNKVAALMKEKPKIDSVKFAKHLQERYMDEKMYDETTINCADFMKLSFEPGNSDTEWTRWYYTQKKLPEDFLERWGLDG